ncbi:MAG: STAS domain-containing protein [Planctomycetes bacterium]|jgi:anti-anti-sigma factor|nr:STAS domain-containing protein [Planctomycetota bacterium]MBL7189853.1 STAS domain-containing protein [Phycisphaerae bacterium]
MGVRNLSEDVLLVTLPQQPQQSDELEAVNTMLSEAIDRDIVIDFSKVEMLTSESICGLLILAKLLAGAGHQLVLCSAPPAINDIFVRTGLLSVFEFANTESDALTHLKNRKMSWSEA